MPIVSINNDKYYARSGEKLSEVLMKNGMYAEHPCGGKGICKKCIVSVDGKEELSCQYEILKDISVALPKKGEIVSESGAKETGVLTENICFVLDIGTTTLALALVSLDEKKIIKTVTRTNPQIAFGADIISRIAYCNNNGVEGLNGVLVNAVNEMVEETGAAREGEMLVAGNTVMLHIFFGIDPSSMGVAPYTPVFLEARTEDGKAVGLRNITRVMSLPCVDAFMGADLVAGINYVGMPSENKYNLLVDLGTNAEAVLYSAEGGVCTSSAVGPCLEGADISHGMSATSGAIYSFRLNTENGVTEAEIKTIGGAVPEGICGTGLVDIIAELLKSGIIDETGYMECEYYHIADGVGINQDDVRQYQIAKSAVYSGINSLIKGVDIKFDDIEKMYISGGFSAKINIDNGTRTGLLPKGLKSKAVAVNNSSLLGAVKYAIEKNDLSRIINNLKYINLSSDPVFTRVFIENMDF